MKKIFVYTCLLVFPFLAFAQQKVDHLIVITTDGLRWQEVFTGLDSFIANQKRFNQGDSNLIYKKYWNNDPAQRRKLLMPFFWSTWVGKGQIYGNRLHNNLVNIANPYRFSYPGYNEIFTGYPDTAVNSNEYPPNPHTNVLEYLHQQPAYKGKIAAFTAWEAFNRILNEGRSGIPVVAAFDTTAGKNLTPQQRLINKMLTNSYKAWQGECLDVFTHYAAMEHLKTAKPKILYISYGETDEWAHAGQYRDYLNATNQLDKWLQEIWNTIQTSPEYKNRTALLISVDHGRGAKDEWTSHGKNIEGAQDIWFAVLSPNLPAKGEVKTKGQLYQQQLAQTMANLLGMEFKANHPIAESLIKNLQ